MDKQLEVLKYLQTVDTATIEDIYQNIPFGYYCNANKHLGALLSRMVAKNKIIRVKKGVFRTVSKVDYKDSQIGLFK